MHYRSSLWKDKSTALRATHSPITARKGGTHGGKVRGACEILKSLPEGLANRPYFAYKNFGLGPITQGYFDFPGNDFLKKFPYRSYRPGGEGVPVPRFAFWAGKSFGVGQVTAVGLGQAVKDDGSGAGRDWARVPT
jgi:hypothetical protein